MGFRAKQQAETSSIRFVDFNNRIEHASTKKVPLCDEKQNPCEKNSINKNIKKKQVKQCKTAMTSTLEDHERGMWLNLCGLNHHFHPVSLHLYGFTFCTLSTFSTVRGLNPCLLLKSPLNCSASFPHSTLESHVLWTIPTPRKPIPIPHLKRFLLRSLPGIPVLDVFCRRPLLEGCKYIYMNIYIIYIYICIILYLYIYTCTSMYIYTHVYQCIHLYLFIYIYICVYMYL